MTYTVNRLISDAEFDAVDARTRAALADRGFRRADRDRCQGDDEDEGRTPMAGTMMCPMMQMMMAGRAGMWMPEMMGLVVAINAQLLKQVKQ